MAFDCRSDRVAYARRGKLSSSESLALQAHLQACDSCRLDLDIGADFDGLDQPEWDDGQRIERLAAKLSRGQRRPRRKPVLRVLAMAACFLLVAGIAAAAAVRFLTPKEPLAGAGSAPSARAQTAQTKPLALALATASASSVALEPAASVPSSMAVSDEAAPTPVPARTATPSAAQLFRSANEARRAGQSQKAMQTYGALQREHPGSPEAALSLVSLGNLLSSESPRGALAQFDRYLATSPNGAVAAEALYGRGRALQTLGRGSEERSTWQELLARYPHCPYVDRATRRLTELR